MSGADMKPGYKRTEVGVIPEDWEVRNIQSMSFDISDGNYSSKYPKSSDFRPVGIPFIRANNIRGQTVIDDDMRFISVEQHQELQKGHLKANDILITTRGEIGQLAIVPNRHVNSNINAQLVRINCSQTKIDHRFLVYVMSSSNAREQFDNLQTGSALKQLPVGRLVQFTFPVPHSEEQRAIANALSDVDALLTKLDQLIAKKRDLKQATMQQLLTGQTRLPGFSGEWEVKRLGDVASLKNGYTFKSETYNPLGCYKVITIANVQDGYMALDDCNSVDKTPPDIQSHQLLKIGDILISMTGNVGRICRVSEDFCLLNQRVGKLVPTLVPDNFLFALMRQPSFIVSMSTAAKGGAQPNLSSADIVSYEFSIPADTAEQTAIANILSEIDAELTALQARRDKTRTLKQGMMQELLTGRVRLI